MHRTTVVAAGLLAVVLVSLPGAARAQVKLEVTPWFASYYATNYTAFKSDDENERQEAGPGIGLGVNYHFTRIVGVQFQATWVRSGIVPRQPQSAGTLTILTPLPGSLTFATARATVQPRRSNYFLAGGVGVVRRAGKAWRVTGLNELTNVLATAGFGIRARITPEREFAIGVDLAVYRSNPDGGAPYYQPRIQRDVLVTIGIPFALVGR